MAAKSLFSPVLLAATFGFLFAGNVARAQSSSEKAVPRIQGLGSFGRQVTTSSPNAQEYFNQGLCLLYAFNHDEAIRSFRHAAQLDPSCAMAWWGISLANGPHINNPYVTPERSQAAWEALTQARQYAQGAAPVEQALIEALGARYAQPAPEDRTKLDQAYAHAMREVWKRYPHDADVGALFAESLMDLRPWDLWSADGKPQPGTEEVVTTLESVLARTPDHPLALHLHIHAVEASPNPEQAKTSADRLRDLQPGLGHLVHMPSHIDVRLGDWGAAIVANQKAIAADRAYRQQVSGQDFYRVYMAHNYHMLAYAAMMRGQSQLAIDQINEMVREIPADWLQQNAMIADGFSAMPLEVLVRFGRWDEILAAPEPAPHLPLARCLWHGARGIAFAAQGHLERARMEQRAFQQARSAVSPEAAFGNNKGHDLLNVAEKLLAGEILYREGKVDEAVAALRAGAHLEDQLRYSEPPDWIHPVRHALGAVLIQERRGKEAERVYQEDLAKMPHNVWSLYGLAQACKLQGRSEDAAKWEAQFRQAAQHADVKIQSSCFCQQGL